MMKVMILMNRFLTKKEFFEVILDDQSVKTLKSEDSKKLHYLQLIFFKPWMAKISVTLYLLLTTLPLFLISIFWLKIIVFGVLFYLDYKHRKILVDCLTKDLCLYEIFSDGEE